MKMKPATDAYIESILAVRREKYLEEMAKYEIKKVNFKNKHIYNNKNKNKNKNKNYNN